MRTVTIRLSGEDFSTAIMRMRDWLERNQYAPKSFRYDQNENTIMVSVAFTVDAQAKAFAKHFGGQSGHRRPVLRQTSDAVGVRGTGGC